MLPNSTRWAFDAALKTFFFFFLEKLLIFTLCFSLPLYMSITFLKHNIFIYWAPNFWVTTWFKVPGCLVPFTTEWLITAQCFRSRLHKKWLWIGVLRPNFSFIPTWLECSKRGAAGRRWPSPTDKLICIRSLGLKWRKWYEGRAAERNKERQSGQRWLMALQSNI